MSAVTCSPDDNLTYAEEVKLAACMHQLYTTGEVALAIGNPWYQNYVDYSKANKIIDKDNEWDAPATRAGYIEIFAGVLPDEAYNEINNIKAGSIPDVPDSHASAAAIYKLYRAGIVQGVNDEHYCDPSSYIKRAEVAAIINRMIDETARIEFTII